MRPLVILVTLGVLATLALGKAAGSEGSWPCCDDCGICNKKFPPECQCDDISARGCHPECKNCVKNIGTIKNPPGGHGGPGPVVTYRCADMLTNFCEHRCTPAPAPESAAAVAAGDVF